MVRCGGGGGNGSMFMLMPDATQSIGVSMRHFTQQAYALTGGLTPLITVPPSWCSKERVAGCPLYAGGDVTGERGASEWLGVGAPRVSTTSPAFILYNPNVGPGRHSHTLCPHFVQASYLGRSSPPASRL